MGAPFTPSFLKQKADRRDAGDLSHTLWGPRQQSLEGKHPHGLRRVLPPTAQEADDRQLKIVEAKIADGQAQ